MNLRASFKNSYGLLADKARQNRASWALFRAVRSFRVLHELITPQRFFEKTIVVRDAANEGRASFSVWGNESSLSYLLRRFEGTGLSVVEESAAGSPAPESSISFVWHNRALSSKFRRRGWLILPGMVTSRLDLSRDIGAIRAGFSRSAQRAGQMAKELGYSYEVLTCQGLLRSFYNEMYLPYCESRFGSHPLVKPYELVEALSKDSVLLTVSASAGAVRQSLDNALGGVAIRKVNTSASLVISGLGGDPEEALRRGAVEALYWFAIEWCHSQGVTSLDLGLSHPFLDDGVLRFKAKWGARVEASETGLHNLAVKFLDNGWLGKHFLANHPPIVYGSHKPPTANCQLPTADLIGLAYLAPNDLSRQSFGRLRRSRMMEGLTELVVVSDPESALEAEHLTEGIPRVRFLACYDLRCLADAVNSL
ncbi:MAG: hypothetical protein JW759_09160 [Candidatus Coatesbacteria bacterium]|nr:hypothetical protein [Candidatus Coatesbacteria bacterium]